VAAIDPDLPQYVDDSGTGRDGSVIDAAFLDAWRDAINIQTASATNPTVKPADTIDEVVAARGTQASVDARLDVSLNEDGTLKAQSGYATITQLLGGIGGVNLVQNDDFLVWPAGDAAAPDGYTLGGGGAAVARVGTGLGDTTRKVGDFAAKVTRAAIDATLTRTVLGTAAFTRADFLKGRYAAGGAWVYCATANAARVAVYDGVGFAYSAYHTGGGTWEWLPVTRLINLAATRLDIIPQVNNAIAGNAVFSGLSLVIIDADLNLPHELLCPVQVGTIHFSVGGAVGAALNIHGYQPGRPGIVKDVQLFIKTAPTGQPLIVDVNTWDGAALTSMFSTRPQIGSTLFQGGAQPDTTYARRCFAANSGATRPTGGEITFDVDQVGSGVAGSDLRIEVRALEYQSPLERFQTS
jgi:hypothetical protein